MKDDPKDDIRPKGSVEVMCHKCGWAFWIDCLDPLLPDGPYVCHCCSRGGLGPVPKGEG